MGTLIISIHKQEVTKEEAKRLTNEINKKAKALEINIDAQYAENIEEKES